MRFLQAPACISEQESAFFALTFFPQAKRCDLCGDKHFRSSFSFLAALLLVAVYSSGRSRALFAGLQFFKKKEKKAKKDKAYSYSQKQEAKAF